MTLRLGGDGAITGCTSLEEPTISISGLTMTTPIEAVSGTAAAPSYTFSGDTDNGLYYAGTNSIGLSTSGTSALLIDSVGKVGVGTIAPNADLHVKGPTFVTLNLETTGGSTNQLLFTRSNGGAAATEAIVGHASSGSDFYLYNQLSANLLFGTAGAEKLRLDSSGRLLLGTTNEGHADADNLTIADSVKTGITIRNTNVAGDGSIFFSDDGTGTGEYSGQIEYGHSGDYMRFATAATERMRIYSDGGVSFKKYLEFRDGGDTTQAGYLGSANHLISSGSNTDFTLRAETNLLFAAGGSTERMRIDSSGRLLVGLSSSADDISLAISGNSSGGSGDSKLLLVYEGTAPGSNDTLSSLSFADNSHQTTAGKYAAEIKSQRDGGTWTSGSSMPGRLVFSTTANGASSPTERLRIDSSGKLFTNRTVSSTSGDHPALQINTISTGTASNAFATGIDFQTEGTSRNRLSVTTNNNWIFYKDSGSSEALRIDADGNLLVGTTSATVPGSQETTTIIGSCAIHSTGLVDVAVSSYVDLSHLNTTICGHLYVSSVYSLNAAVRTSKVFFIEGRYGNGFVLTELNSSNGSTGGNNFTITNPSNNIIRMNNTSGALAKVSMSFVGTLGF